MALDGEPCVWAIAGDTDGIDGAEEVAGAIVAPDTLARARAIEMEDEETMADRAFAFLRAYPLEIAIAALLAASGGAIAWNALALQTGHHPAPFFARGRAGQGL